MDRSLRAALFSGLIFPGLGQIMLGKRWFGWLIIASTTVAIIGIVYGIVLRIPFVMEQLNQDLGSGIPDVARIMEITIQSGKRGTFILERMSSWLLVFCWAGSIIHAFLSGKANPPLER